MMFGAMLKKPNFLLCMAYQEQEGNTPSSLALLPVSTQNLKTV